jgi:hypothetical protein
MRLLWLQEKKCRRPGLFAVAVFTKKKWPIGADGQANTEHTGPRSGVLRFYGSRCRKGKAGAHRSSQRYPQPCDDFFPKELNTTSAATFSLSVCRLTSFRVFAGAAPSLFVPGEELSFLSDCRRVLRRLQRGINVVDTWLRSENIWRSSLSYLYSIASPPTLESFRRAAL